MDLSWWLHQDHGRKYIIAIQRLLLHCFFWGSVCVAGRSFERWLVYGCVLCCSALCCWGSVLGHRGGFIFRLKFHGLSIYDLLLLLRFSLRYRTVIRTMARMRVRSMLLGTMMLRIGTRTSGRLTLINTELCECRCLTSPHGEN